MKERQELILKKTIHRLISYSLTMVCLLTMLAVPGRAVNILYSDVPQDAWYMDGVEYVTKNGIMAGTGKGKFSLTLLLVSENFIYSKPFHFDLSAISDKLYVMLLCSHTTRKPKNQVRLFIF